MIEYFSRYILTLTQICVYLYFARLFFKNGKAARIILAACLVSLPMPLVNSLENMTLNLLSALAALFISLLIVFREKLPRLAAMSLVICVLNFLCELAALFFAAFVLKDETETIISENIYGVVYASIALLLFLTITCVVKIILAKRQNTESFVFMANFRVVLLTMVTIVLGYYILYSSQRHQSHSLALTGLIIFILLIAVDVAVMLGSENDLKKYELAKTLEVMKLQEDYYTETIRQMEENQGALAKQAHDFRNHLIHIEEMIHTHKTQMELDEADSYVQSLVRGIDHAGVGDEQGIKSIALRTIVRRLKRRCKDFSIDLHTNIQYSDFSYMQFKDICSFFANAFDNSIWACQQIGKDNPVHKWITVDIEKRHEYARIKIANTSATSVVKNRLGFISQKGSQARLGIGTQNMKRSIERYGGTMDVDDARDAFTVRAIIPIPQQN